jgi:hypothetical protein
MAARQLDLRAAQEAFSSEPGSLEKLETFLDSNLIKRAGEAY